MRISDWSSDVCSSDLGARSSSEDAKGRCQRREGEDRDRDSEAETTDNPKPSGSRRRHLEVGIGFQVAERLAQLPTDQRRQRRIRPDVPAKPERASKPVERHLRGACRAAPAVGCDMRDDMVRSEEHTSELQSLMRNSYSVFWLKKKKKTNRIIKKQKKMTNRTKKDEKKRRIYREVNQKKKKLQQK